MTHDAFGDLADIDPYHYDDDDVDAYIAQRELDLDDIANAWDEMGVSF